MSDPCEIARELLERARAGDDQALGELLDRHRPLLKLLTRQRCDGLALTDRDGSDIVQQATVSVLRGFRNFRGQTLAEFLGWLNEVHHHTVLDVVRQMRTLKRGGGEPPLPLEFDPIARQTSASQEFLRNERAGELAAAIEQLPDDQREAVRLRHLDGRSLQEIALRLNRTEVAVAGLVKRGLSSLRRSLEQ